MARFALAGAVLVLLGLACKDDPPPIDYPEWATYGSRRHEGVVFGVGSVSGITNQALARVTADNRARAEVMALVAGPGNTADGPIGKVTAVSLSGVEVVDHWLHPDGTVYSLAKLGAPVANEECSRSEAEVTAIFGARIPEFMSCIELAKSPPSEKKKKRKMKAKTPTPLPASIQLDFMVEPSGAVGEVEIIGLEPEHSAVRECLEKAVAGSTFAAADGGRCPVTLPLNIAQ